MRRGARGLAFVAVTCLIVACGGANGPEGKGVQRFDAERLSFEYPSGWEEAQRADLEDLLFTAVGPRDARGLFPRVSAYDGERIHATIRAFGKGIKTRRPFEIEEGRAAGDGPIEVAGAAGGWRVDTTFVITTTQGEKVPGRLINILAQDGDREFQLSLAGPEDRLDDPDAQRILRSLRIE